ncbi:MAG: DoxX family protein [Thiobacillus sp.]
MNTLSPNSTAHRESGMLRRGWSGLEAVLAWLQAPALLAARLYVAYVFLASGLESLRSWDATRYLYESEFHVPVLPPHVAAVLGTAGEVLLPPLLLLGLFGRFGALGLFVVNAVALLSYLYALQPPAILFHVIWGILLAVVALWGPGRWSVDHLRERASRR